jgi:GT2 family glycosyltransferase
MRATRVSVVTPTLGRPQEVRGLLDNLSRQELLPDEVLIVDGAPPQERATELVVGDVVDAVPFECRHLRHSGGTAIQRNVGIDAAKGDLIAFIDDDIRLEEDFLQRMVSVFERDVELQIGGVVGYITNQQVTPETHRRWQWYRRLKLYTVFEPGRYDYGSGYPVNRYLQPPYSGTKEMDFISSGCAVWRSDVFGDGLRFDPFFKDYGLLEDAHLSLRAGRDWTLLECGDAHCVHLKSGSSRESPRLVARKTVINYYYVFSDIVPQRSWKQKFRFWRLQLFEVLRFTLKALRSPSRGNWLRVLGKTEGIVIAATELRVEQRA